MNNEVYKDAQKVNLITLLRTFKKEGLENFIVIRRNKFENLLKENEKNDKAKKYILKKQSIQYKYALSKIECEELLKILEGK